MTSALRALPVLALPVLACGLALACAPAHDDGDDAPAPRTFPTVDELPDLEGLPDLMGSFFTDARVESAQDFDSWRRDELRALFAHYMFGPAPALTVASLIEVARHARVDDLDVDAIELLATLSDERALAIAVFVPSGQSNVPAVLAPNRCGNQSVALDERLSVTAHPDADCNAARGAQRDKWPLSRIAAEGFAFVTFHQSDLAVDDAALGGVEALSAWARGSALALDALEEADTPVDASRVAVFGHSRRGKAALLAGARDERFAAVVAHQSGTCGQSIIRNGLGESLFLITGVFPHWFTPELSTFGEREQRLPVDGHMLVALQAPRPVLLVDAREDDWADPQGALEAARVADAAWELFGDDGLVEEDGPDGRMPRTDATLVWQLREGGHDQLESDWELFLPFLSRHLR